jgi:hypothetical protein
VNTTVATIAAGLFSVTLSIGGAGNGVLIVQKTTSGTTQTTHQIQIEQTRMRAEMADQAGTQRAMIFDGARQVMLIVNPDRKSYSEITKDDVDRMGAQMQDMMAKVPPEMRAKVEEMMKGRGMSGAPVKTEYKKTGTDKVGKWTCDKYDGYQNGQKTSEVCTVEPSALGLAAGDFAVTSQFAAFFEKLVPQSMVQVFNLGQAQAGGFSGLPVRSISTTGGRTVTSEITDVSRQTFPDSVFAVPAGFQKEASPFGRGRGRQ